MKQKKKFFETDLGRVLKGAASIVAPKLVSILEHAKSPEDALDIIREAPIAPEDRLKLEEIALQHESELTKRLESDNSQELWLPKLVRPITLAVLTTAYITGFFLEYPVETLHAPLMTVFGFYFGGRSLEKLFTKHK